MKKPVEAAKRAAEAAETAREIADGLRTKVLNATDIYTWTVNKFADFIPDHLLDDARKAKEELSSHAKRAAEVAADAKKQADAAARWLGIAEAAAETIDQIEPAKKALSFAHFAEEAAGNVLSHAEPGRTAFSRLQIVATEVARIMKWQKFWAWFRIPGKGSGKFPKGSGKFLGLFGGVFAGYTFVQAVYAGDDDQARAALAETIVGLTPVGLDLSGRLSGPVAEATPKALDRLSDRTAIFLGFKREVVPPVVPLPPSSMRAIKASLSLTELFYKINAEGGNPLAPLY